MNFTSEVEALEVYILIRGRLEVAQNLCWGRTKRDLKSDYWIDVNFIGYIRSLTLLRTKQKLPGKT
jgi:hypothetical protein